MSDKISKSVWLKNQFVILNTKNFEEWSEIREGLNLLFEKHGENVTRTAFWEAFGKAYHQNHMNHGQPTSGAIYVWEYFLNEADFDAAWETSPLTNIPPTSGEKMTKALTQESFVKIGGTPEWIQSNETPICRYCDRDMTLLIELHSTSKELRDQYPELKEINFGDSGKIYLFKCFRDAQLKAVYQCY